LVGYDKLPIDIFYNLIYNDDVLGNRGGHHDFDLHLTRVGGYHVVGQGVMGGAEMSTYKQVADTFTDEDDFDTRVATMDAVTMAELEAIRNCPCCNGEGHTGGTMIMTPDGPQDDSAKCDWCDGTGKAPAVLLSIQACPECGECRVDHLTADMEDSDFITCDCGCQYDLNDMSDLELRRESR
jgi:hypothetical protein